MAASTSEQLLGKVGENNGKSAVHIQPPTQPPLRCPECTSQQVWKDGFRYVKTETGQLPIQRYLCRRCGRRFSEESKESYSPSDHSQGRQVCVSEQEMKNLSRQRTRVEKRAAGATINLRCKEDLKGKLVEYAWWMKKQGYAETTIKQYTNTIRILTKRGADVDDSESVKEVIAQQEWSGQRRNVAIASYTLLLKTHNQTWDPPKCHITRKLPFIPTEQEIDALIAGCGRKTATFLQLIKETAMRSGEAGRLKWINIDTEKRTIILNEPEKNSLPRIFKVSNKLIDMLNALSKTSEKLFGDRAVKSGKTTFYRSRKLIAQKLQNPRILRIHFHTLRHWKATMLYHQTKDVIYVKNFLGHKKIENTLLYIQLAEVIFKETTDEFMVRIAESSKDITGLLEVGFEYVCEKNGLMYFRKRK